MSPGFEAQAQNAFAPQPPTAQPPPRWLRCEAVHGRASKPPQPAHPGHPPTVVEFQPRVTRLRGSGAERLRTSAIPMPSADSTRTVAEVRGRPRPSLEAPATLAHAQAPAPHHKASKLKRRTPSHISQRRKKKKRRWLRCEAVHGRASKPPQANGTHSRVPARVTRLRGSVAERLRTSATVERSHHRRSLRCEAVHGRASKPPQALAPAQAPAPPHQASRLRRRTPSHLSHRRRAGRLRTSATDSAATTTVAEVRGRPRPSLEASAASAPRPPRPPTDGRRVPAPCHQASRLRRRTPSHLSHRRRAGRLRTSATDSAATTTVAEVRGRPRPSLEASAASAPRPPRPPTDGRRVPAPCHQASRLRRRTPSHLSHRQRSHHHGG